MYRAFVHIFNHGCLGRIWSVGPTVSLLLVSFHVKSLVACYLFALLLEVDSSFFVFFSSQIVHCRRRWRSEGGTS